MEFLVGLLVAVKSLVFMGGYIAPDKAQVSIASMQVIVTRQDVMVSCEVANAFPADIKKLAQSGTPILLYVFAEARQVQKDSLVGSAVAEKRLEYDLVAKQYRVTGGGGGDTLTFAILDSALAACAGFARIAVLPKDKIKPDKSYYFIMWAVLGKAKVEALANKEIDLMYFWNYQRPSLRTDPFKGGQFLAFPK
jgi:hypothetical protein